MQNTKYDPLTIYNEQVKALATFFAAMGISTIVASVIRPAIDQQSPENTASFGFFVAGLVIWSVSPYILSYLRKVEDSNDGI